MNKRVNYIYYNYGELLVKIVIYQLLENSIVTLFVLCYYEGIKRKVGLY